MCPSALPSQLRSQAVIKEQSWITKLSIPPKSLIVFLTLSTNTVQEGTTETLKGILFESIGL